MPAPYDQAYLGLTTLFANRGGYSLGIVVELEFSVQG